MKKKEFINLIESVVNRKINKLIKKEIQKEVKKSLNEIFIERGKSLLLEQPNSFDSSQPLDESSLSELINPPSKNSQFEHKDSYENSSDAINYILAETNGGLAAVESNIGDTSQILTSFMNAQPELSRMNGASVKIDTASPLAQTKREIAAVQTIKEAGSNVDAVPDHIKKAMTRDYSKLVKAM